MWGGRISNHDGPGGADITLPSGSHKKILPQYLYTVGIPEWTHLLDGARTPRILRSDDIRVT